MGLSKGRATGYKIERGMQKDKAQRNKGQKKPRHTKFQYSVKELAEGFKHNIEKTHPISLEEARAFLARLPMKRGR